MNDCQKEEINIPSWQKPVNICNTLWPSTFTSHLPHLWPSTLPLTSPPLCFIKKLVSSPLGKMVQTSSLLNKSPISCPNTSSPNLLYCAGSRMSLDLVTVQHLNQCVNPLTSPPNSYSVSATEPPNRTWF